MSMEGRKSKSSRCNKTGGLFGGWLFLFFFSEIFSLCLSTNIYRLVPNGVISFESYNLKTSCLNSLMV